MKLSVLQENLAKAVSLANKARARANRSTLPVLSNVLLQANGDTLNVSANNLELGITVSIGAKVASSGEITVPAKLLADLVSSLPQERVDIQMNEETMSVDIRCGRVQSNIKGIDAKEFHTVVTTGNRITMFDGEILKQALGLVTFAASSEESRPIFTGVLFDIKSGSLSMAAADGFRLSVLNMPHEYDGEPARFVIPARVLDVLRGAIGEDDEHIEMLLSLNERAVIFKLENLVLVSNTIQGDFPDYTRIIPQQHSTRTTVGAATMLKSVKLANLFSRDSANIVKLEIFPPSDDLDSGRIDFYATSAELGNNESGLDAGVEGNVCEVAFNGKYLVDVLSAVEAPQIIIDTNGPGSPGVFRMYGRDDFVHVIMPMHIQPRLEVG